MIGENENPTENDMKVHLSMVSSFCHSLVDFNGEPLEHIVALLQNHFQKYKKKHPISYSDCCNSFNTDYHEKKNGCHRVKSALHIHYLLNLKSLTTTELSQFIKRNGWADDNGRIVYPGWGLACFDYGLEKRHTIVKENHTIIQLDQTREQDHEEETLQKRCQVEQEKCTIDNQERADDLQSTKTPIKNKYFNREQYHNEQYKRMKRERTSDEKERSSTAKKERKQQEKSSK